SISAILISGALGQQIPPSNQPARPPASAAKAAPATPPPPPKADPKAIEVLNKAIDALDPKKLGLLETKLWEQVDTVGLTFQAEGSYVSAAKDRLRLDLRVDLGKTRSQLLVVSDGAWVWNQIKLGNDEPLISKYDLAKVHETLNAPGTMPTVAEGFYRSNSFRGVVPLLEAMSKQMTFTKLENATWKGHDVYKLTAVWSPDMTKTLAPPGQTWPAFTPRTCHLYLGNEKDKPAYWPYRLEWLGPAGQVEDSLLMQMEFRDPHVLPASANLPTQYAT